MKISILKEAAPLEKVFEKSRLYFSIHIIGIGLCYVSMTIYQPNKVKINELTYFSFDICPKKSKIQHHCLILNSIDLEIHWNIKTEYIISENKHLMVGLGRLLLKKFALRRHNNYKKLKLSIYDVEGYRTDAKPYILSNNMNLAYFENKMKHTPYLESKLYEPKIIIQFVKKFNHLYFIVTIEYVYKFDYWNMMLYSSGTSRNFICKINMNDLMNLKLEFLDRIYPKFMKSMVNAKFKDYKDFHDTYKKRCFLQIRKSGLKATNLEDFEKSKLSQSLIDKIKQLSGNYVKTLLSINKIYSLKFLSPKLFEESFADNQNEHTLNYNELKFWENFIKRFELIINSNGEVFIKNDTFITIMKEYIFKSTTQMDKSTDTIVEIFIDSSPNGATIRHLSTNEKFDKENRNPFISAFDHITYLKSSYYIVVIKIYYMNFLICQEEKINLREIVNLYIADGFSKYQANYIDAKFNASELENFGDYIIFKIKNSGLVTLIHDKTNNNIDNITLITNDQAKTKGYNKNESILLYRSLLSNYPSYLVTLYYESKKGIVYGYVYSQHDSSISNTNFSLIELKNQFPLIEVQLKHKLYNNNVSVRKNLSKILN